MKKLMLTFGLFLAGISLMYSQTKATPPAPNGEKMVEKMKQVCNLTPDQVAKVKPMAATFAQTREQNKEKYKGNPEGMKTAMKTAKDSYMEQLKTVLSADQMTKWQNSMDGKKPGKPGGNKQ